MKNKSYLLIAIGFIAGITTMIVGPSMATIGHWLGDALMNKWLFGSIIQLALCWLVGMATLLTSGWSIVSPSPLLSYLVACGIAANLYGIWKGIKYCVPNAALRVEDHWNRIGIWVVSIGIVIVFAGPMAIGAYKRGVLEMAMSWCGIAALQFVTGVLIWHSKDICENIQRRMQIAR